MLIAYASRTSSRRNVATLRLYGWRFMLSPGKHESPDGFPYALDNGAWSAFQQKRPFDEVAFAGALERRGSDADFVVVPDIVAGGLPSLEFSLSWLARVTSVARRSLIAVQDGMSPHDVKPLLNKQVGIFIGGTTEWKLQTAPTWGDLKRETGCYLHVGRVNTRRRINLCIEIGADSFDGTSATMYSRTIPLLDSSRRQIHLLEHGRLLD